MSYNSIGTGTNKIISATSKTNLITSVDIDFSKMETASTSRSVRVVGDSNAVFSLQVSRSSNGQFYNFSTNTFSATSMGSSSGSSTSSYTQSNAPTVNFRDTQLTVPSSASDFGVNITGCTTDCVNGTWNTNALYWQTGNYVANGAGTSSTALILYIGMQVAYVNGVFQTALRAITAINTTTKTVTLDGNETWSNDHVILFRAYGIDLISSAININLTLANPTVRLGQLSTTLRTVIESGQATADVNGTKGIGAGAIARCRFINNSTSTSASKISAVTGSTTAGVITITNAEFTAGGYVGDIIYIDNFSNLIFLTGDISITRYPTADQTIYIDTSKFLTAGAAS